MSVVRPSVLPYPSISPRPLDWFHSYFIQWWGTMVGWCTSNKILAMCQNVVIMAVFLQNFTSFCHISKTYGPILLIFGTVMKYHKALINIKQKLAPCQIMVIMTHFHNTQQYLQDPWPDSVHILYSEEVLWWVNARQIRFWLCAKMWWLWPFFINFWHLFVISERPMDRFCWYLVQWWGTIRLW